MRCDSDPITGREFNCGSEVYEDPNPETPPPLVENEDGVLVPESV